MSITNSTKFRVLKFSLPVVALLIFIHACSKKPEVTVDCSGPVKSFVTDVSPVFQTSCAINSGCHATGSGNGPGPLLNYSQIFNARADIRPAVASGHMPLNATLTTTEKNAILCWIDNGAPNN
ncbi:MAG TPA: hypothetical protein VIU35_12250 [Chitinophagaceae bacterium]